MQARHAGLDSSGFTGAFQRGFDLDLRLLDNLFDARRVDAAILHQMRERDARHFPPDGVESRERDVGGDTLQRGCDDFARAALRLLGVLGLDLVQATVGVFSHLALDLGEQQVARLAGGQAGDAFDLLQALLAQLLQPCTRLFELLLALSKLTLAAFKRLGAAFQVFFFLGDAPLLFLQLGGTLADLHLRLGAQADRFLLRLQQRFLLTGLGVEKDAARFSLHRRQVRGGGLRAAGRLRSLARTLQSDNRDCQSKNGNHRQYDDQY